MTDKTPIACIQCSRIVSVDEALGCLDPDCTAYVHATNALLDEANRPEGQGVWPFDTGPDPWERFLCILAFVGAVLAVTAIGLAFL